MKSNPPLEIKQLIRYAEGEVTQSEAKEIQAQLDSFPWQRGQLQQIEQTMAHLSHVDEMPDADRFIADIHGRIAQAQPTKQVQPWSSWQALSLAAAACLMLICTWGLRSSPPPAADSEFHAKAATAGGDPREQWIGLKVYHVGTDPMAKPVQGLIAASDGLSFSYTNLGKSPFGYLMVFAVDARGYVYWYYPSYTDPQTDLSVKIQTGKQNVDLREAIRHRLPGGSIALYGLFSDHPFAVSKIEQTVAKWVEQGQWNVTAPRRWELEHVGQKVMQIKVAK